MTDEPEDWSGGYAHDARHHVSRGNVEMRLFWRAPDKTVVGLETIGRRLVERLASAASLVESDIRPVITSGGGFFVCFAWSEQPPNSVVERFQPSLHGRIIVEQTDGVV